MENETRENLVDGSIWMRGFHMLLFSIAYNVVEAMLGLIAVFQFFCALITGKVNEPLLKFSKNGSIYIQEVLEFLTFNSEIRPFPFTEWPSEEHTGHEWLGEAAAADAEETEVVVEAEVVVDDVEDPRDK